MKIQNIVTTTAVLASTLAGTAFSHGQTVTSDSKPKVLFVLTSHSQLGNTGAPTGFYLPEVTHPHHVLTQAGFTIDYVSPKGGKAPMVGDDQSDPLNKAFLADAKNRAAIENTLRPDQVKASDYVAIFYAGGHGTMWDFAENAALATLAGRIYDDGGVVAAVCHGPAGLVNIKLANGNYLVAGKTIATFTNSEEVAAELEKVVPYLLADKLIERGAKHEFAPDFEKKVVVSERLVTGQNPASATGVAEEMAKLLKSAAKK